MRTAIILEKSWGRPLAPAHRSAHCHPALQGARVCALLAQLLGAQYIEPLSRLLAGA
jgi:hypothetical protein